MMRVNQPYLHLAPTGDQIYELQALIAVPDGWKFSMVCEILTHDVPGERLILIALDEDAETSYDGTLQVSFPLEESDQEMKILVEVGDFSSEETLYDVFGSSAIYLADASSNDEPIDRMIGGGGKKIVTSSTQIIRDPV